MERAVTSAAETFVIWIAIKRNRSAFAVIALAFFGIRARFACARTRRIATHAIDARSTAAIGGAGARRRVHGRRNDRIRCRIFPTSPRAAIFARSPRDRIARRFGRFRVASSSAIRAPIVRTASDRSRDETPTKDANQSLDRPQRPPVPIPIHRREPFLQKDGGRSRNRVKVYFPVAIVHPRARSLDVAMTFEAPSYIDARHLSPKSRTTRVKSCATHLPFVPSFRRQNGFSRLTLTAQTLLNKLSL